MSDRVEPLARSFSRRMAPLALVAGVLVGAVLPWVYGRFELAERRGEAAAFAQQLAREFESLARERPQLWPYDEGRLQAISEPLLRDPVRARVRLDVADADGIFLAGPERTDEVAGWAIVAVHGRPQGRVQVRLDAAALRQTIWMSQLLGGGLGLVLALALFLLPLATVRRGDRRNQALWGELADANTQLEVRVADRTAELRAREVELKQLGARLVAVQEEERKRLSRDLHDELGQTLTALRLQLTLAQAQSPAAIGARLTAAIEVVDQGVEQVRSIAHTLRPPALDALGLPAALSSHARRWAEAAGLVLELEIEQYEPAQQAAEVLFRIAQEALTNITRHAEATGARIVFERVDDGLGLLVDDNGRGFKGGRVGGLGLVGARERAEQVGGYLDVEISPSEGTRIRVWLPEA